MYYKEFAVSNAKITLDMNKFGRVVKSSGKPIEEVEKDAQRPQGACKIFFTESLLKTERTVQEDSRPWPLRIGKYMEKIHSRSNYNVMQYSAVSNGWVLCNVCHTRYSLWVFVSRMCSLCN